MSTDIRLQVVFFKSESGNEPVRDFLKSLDKNERKTIGEDVKTVQFGWPLGMPLIKKIQNDLWEIRSQIINRIARIFFTIYDDKMVLLHGFIKKTQRTPALEIIIAQRRIKQLREKEK